MLAQDQVGFGEADVLGPHDLVGRAFLEHAVLVDAGLVGEGIAADDRLVPLDLDAGDVGDQPAGGHQPLGVDAGFGIIEVGPGAQGHDHFLQGAVAGPFADAVDRALDLPGARFDARQAVGHGQAQVVVAVHADDGLVDIRHAVAQAADHAPHVGGRGIADRVGNVHRVGPRVDCRLDHPAQEVDLGAGCVLGREFDVVAVAGRPADPGHGPLDDLLLVHLELEFTMDGAGGQKDVDPRRFGRFEGFPGPIDVGVVAAGQAADHRSADRLGHLADSLEVAGRSDRESGFDDVDSQVHQGLGNLHLLAQVHARAGRLLAVAQGGVEDPDRAFRAHDSSASGVRGESRS